MTTAEAQRLGTEIAKLLPTPTSKPVADTSSLVGKLAEVMALVRAVPKRGYNDFHKYDYATEGDILAAVRDGLADRGVMILPFVDSTDRREVVLKREGTATVTTLGVRYTITDGREEVVVRMVGEGQDAGDKGAYKALTGAQKYMVLKTFLIPTGDDPERDAPAKQPPRRRTTTRLAAPKAKPAPPAEAPPAHEPPPEELAAAQAKPAASADLVARLRSVIRRSEALSKKGQERFASAFPKVKARKAGTADAEWAEWWMEAREVYEAGVYVNGFPAKELYAAFKRQFPAKLADGTKGFTWDEPVARGTAEALTSWLERQAKEG